MSDFHMGLAIFMGRPYKQRVRIELFLVEISSRDSYDTRQLGMIASVSSCGFFKAQFDFALWARCSQYISYPYHSDDFIIDKLLT